MITDEQWKALKAYVTNRLKDEKSFGIHPDAITREFGIPQPMYADLQKCARADASPFEIERHWNSEGEPTTIGFLRLP